MDLPRTVVSDPPWWPKLHANTVGRRVGPYRAGPQRYYPLLTVEQIIALRPETQPKAHLWLWVINQHVDWGYTVARAWGFEPQSMLTWTKPLGTGQFQSSTEHILLCRKGGPAGNAFGRTGGTHFAWPRPRQHSRKPDEAYALAERVSPGPYLEMFARRERAGWQVMGNEVEPSVKAS